MTQLPALADANLAVRSYKSDPDWLAKTGVGGTLNAGVLVLSLQTLFGHNIWFIPLAMALSAVVSGYLVRVAKAKQEDQQSNLPMWNEWSDLIFGGLTWVAVQFAWAVLAAIPITTAFLMGTFGTQAYMKDSLAVAVMFATTGLTIVFSLLVLHFVLSYMMINFASAEKLSAAFNLARLVRYLFIAPKPMLIAWIIAFQLQLAAIIVPCLTVVGLLFTPTTFFAAQIIGISLMAQVWHDVAEADKYGKSKIAKTES